MSRLSTLARYKKVGHAKTIEVKLFITNYSLFVGFKRSGAWGAPVWKQGISSESFCRLLKTSSALYLDLGGKVPALPIRQSSFREAN